MAFYLGNFTGGLFQGAQSVASLYSAYQGIMNQQAWSDAADEVKQARQVQDASTNVDKTVEGLRTQYGTPGVTDQPGYQAPGDQPATDKPAEEKPATDQPPAKPTVDVPKVAALTGATLPGFTPGQTDAAIRARQELAASPGTGVQISSGVGPPAVPPPVALAPPATQIPPQQFSQDTGLPLPQSGPPAAPPVPPQPGVPLAQQPLRGIPNVDEYGRVIPSSQTQVTPAAIPPSSVPPSTAQRTVDEYGRPIGPAPASPQAPGPPPMAQEAPAPSPPSGAPSWQQRTLQGHGMVPPSAPPTVPTTPPAAGAPTIGGRIVQALSNLNPIGTAHATGGVPGDQPPAFNPAQADASAAATERAAVISAKNTGKPAPIAGTDTVANPDGTISKAGAPAPAPAQAPAAQANTPEQQLAVAQAQAKDSNQPVKMADGRTVNPNGTVDNPPAQGVTPAKPPQAATPPSQTSEAPVTVAPGKAGKVTADQAAPSKQSEVTPPALAPPISPRAWQWGQQNRPELANLIKEVVDQHGGGAVNYEQVAAIIQRESNWQVNADASVHYGMGHGQGLMQIEPGTQATYNMGGKLNPFNARDNITMGVELLKDLAIGPKFNLGSGTVQQNLAYMRGMGGVNEVKASGWDAYAATHPIAARGLTAMYDGNVPFHTGQFTGGGGGAYDARQIVQAAHQDGPDGLLHVLATTGPAGMGMTDRWRSAQSALEYAAIRSGHMDMLPVIQDWISQQSHQGAISNLMAADQALLSGNPQGAADALAKAHAFFPDGSYARFGPDNKGTMWAQQFSEATGKELGKPFQITHEALMGQIVAMQNPATYVQTLQKMQLTNAQIDQTKAHAQYYREMPEVRQEAIGARTELGQTKIQAGIDAAERKRQHDVEMENLRQQHREELRGEQEKSTTALDTGIRQDYKLDNKPPEVDSQTWANRSEIDRRFRMPSSQGGAGLGGPAGQAVAEGVAGGKYKLHGIVRGGVPGYEPRDANGKVVAPPISKEQGDILLSMPGLEKIAGAKRIEQPAGAGGPQQRASVSPVGAGAGSYAALQGGYNQNLAALPQVPMPQQQPQQTMTA